MKRGNQQLFPLMLALALAAVTLFPSSVSAAPVSGTARSVSIFVATDRHAKSDGNNLPAVLAEVAADPDAVAPSAAIIGGDNQNAGAYSVNDMYEELAAVFGDGIDGYYTYGSHDKMETGDYSESFFSSAEVDGIHLYSINYGQMLYDTEAQASDDGYTGLDKLDRRGYSAETAVPLFLEWVEGLEDNRPIVIMSHVPLHLNRNDNLAAASWTKAVNEAAATHDILFLWGHNHSREEYEDKYGPSQDYYYYLVLPGETMPVQGAEEDASEEIELAFTYANAGYLKLGFGSLLTYTDADGDGSYDELQIKRYSIDPEYDGAFSKSGYYSPFTMQLTKWAELPERVELRGNGTEQTAYPDTEYYTVTGGSATGPGNYTATMTLRDGSKWTDGGTEPMTVEYTILTPVSTYVIIAVACAAVAAAAVVLIRKKQKTKNKITEGK